MLLPGRSDGEETTGEATAVSAMTGNDRRAERASNDEPDRTAQATTGLTTLPLAHLSVGLIRLEFRIEDGRIGIMQGTVVSTPTKNKPKLLDQRVKASLTRQE